MSASSSEQRYLSHPARFGPEDDYLHPAPGPGLALWGDTVWLSTIDPAAGIVGLQHLHVTDQGFARVQAHYWIDGVQQTYGCRVPVTVEPGMSRWLDGPPASYEVVEPYKCVRMTMDTPRFGYELEFTARSPVFDYDDCAGGNPLDGLKPVAAAHGGHFEQALRCRGTFEIRGGPAAGETRQIDCLSHRDHTWSDRFASSIGVWEREEKEIALHFWLILQFPERNFNAVGFFDPAAFGVSGRPRGGAELSERGCRPLSDVVPVPGYDGDAAAMHYNGPQRYRLEIAGGETLHIRATRRYGTAKLWMRAENDLENVLDDYEDIVDLEIEETGEVGYGILEYSVLPGMPRFTS